MRSPLGAEEIKLFSPNNMEGSFLNSPSMNNGNTHEQRKKIFQTRNLGLGTSSMHIISGRVEISPMMANSIYNSSSGSSLYSPNLLRGMTHTDYRYGDDNLDVIKSEPAMDRLMDLDSNSEFGKNKLLKSGSAGSEGSNSENESNRENN